MQNFDFNAPDEAFFLGKYPKCREKLERSGRPFGEFLEVAAEYARRQPTFEAALNSVRQQLGSNPAVHSVRARLKDPEHLLEKLIRKSDPTKEPVTAANLQERVTDLIGLRAIHLFKGEWKPIHEYVSDTWDMKETPQARIRAGDDPSLVEGYRAAGLEVVTEESGYRSIHYVVETKPAKQKFFVEIQVRTLFEEGWSEVDHRVRYPYGASAESLVGFLSVFNRLAGGADELASLIIDLRDETVASQGKYQALSDGLKDAIGQVRLSEDQKKGLNAKIEALKAEHAVQLALAGFAGMIFSPVKSAGTK